MKILVSYRGIPQSPGWATGDFVVKAFKALGHDAHAYAKYYMEDRWIEDPKALLFQQYDLYLQMECGDGDMVYQEMWLGKKRATWWFDAALYLDRWRHETAMISADVNFIANKNLVGQNSNFDVYLPYAADNDKHVIPMSFSDGKYAVAKDVDFLIIGSPRPERESLYASVAEAIPDAKVAYITNAFREEYISYLTRSHYVINDVAGGGAGLIPMRPFETIAAGSHLITPHGDGVRELGIPCLEYRNSDELLMLVKELAARERPIRFGFQSEFLKKHTYVNRCQEILRIIGE